MTSEYERQLNSSSIAELSDSDTSLIKMLIIILVALGIFLVICCICFYLQYQRFLEAMQLNAVAREAEAKRKKSRRDVEASFGDEDSLEVSKLRRSYFQRYRDGRRSSSHHQRRESRDTRRDRRTSKDRRRRFEYRDQPNDGHRGRRKRHSSGDRHRRRTGSQLSPSGSHVRNESPARESHCKRRSPSSDQRTSPTSTGKYYPAQPQKSVSHSKRLNKQRDVSPQHHVQKELPMQTQETTDISLPKSTKTVDNGSASTGQNQQAREHESKEPKKPKELSRKELEASMQAPILQPDLTALPRHQQPIIFDNGYDEEPTVLIPCPLPGSPNLTSQPPVIFENGFDADPTMLVPCPSSRPTGVLPPLPQLKSTPSQAHKVEPTKQLDPSAPPFVLIHDPVVTKSTTGSSLGSSEVSSSVEESTESNPQASPAQQKPSEKSKSDKQPPKQKK